MERHLPEIFGQEVKLAAGNVSKLKLSLRDSPS